MTDNKVKIVVKRGDEIISEKNVILKPVNLDARCKINDLLFEHLDNPNKNFFSRCVQMIKLATDYTDDEINKFENEEIYQFFQHITNLVNKKK
ncbi:MAG: hypothetical protein Unbinned2514contig1001_42 [Prokaryotic dsDNA virus sp.]|nr:MAG: hypothetical protein Unbinned2514contig1001_42 [Prokaryotic dsDNA virus sp.]|tara:strand:- start:8182 stop:8460 length:279 start_codon:yes stop_codon:yes gene_type:complete